MSHRAPRPRTGEPTLATRSARGERTPAPRADEGRPTSEPLYQTAVFDFDDIASAEAAITSQGYFYARHGLPNARSLEQSLCALEGGERALVTSSGMSAIFVALLAATKGGERVLCQRDVYGGTHALFEHEAARLGLTVEYVDAREPAKVADGLGRGARFVFVETLSNPLLCEADIAALAWHTRASGAVLCVDNTLATPVFKRPLALGADLVVHSLTKFMGGHHDTCAGALLGAATANALMQRAHDAASRIGLQSAPLDAWLVQRGLRTLALRMQRSHTTARALAAELAAHPRVREVHYPGWGGLLSLDVGDRESAERVVLASTQIRLTPSLGGTETTWSHPASSSHRALSADERARLGIGDGLLRLSVGLEEATDLWEELSRALG